MLFSRFVVFLFGLLPEKNKAVRDLSYILNYGECRQRVIAWHNAELKKLDCNSRLQQTFHRLVVSRERALAAGVGPIDACDPDILDYYPQKRVDAVTKACSDALKPKPG